MAAHDPWRFEDRRQAGRELARAVAALSLTDPVVLALPRGGVPVAYEVALALGGPLDLLLVRKLGAPGNPEFGMGAITDGSAPRVYLDMETIDSHRIPRASIDREIARQTIELERRRQVYLEGRSPIDVAGKTVVLVDDGIATGGTVQVALQALRAAGVAKLVLAVPVAPPDALQAMERLTDEIICLSSPQPFLAVGQVYRNFGQTEDADVIALLQQAVQDLQRARDGSA